MTEIMKEIQQTLAELLKVNSALLQEVKLLNSQEKAKRDHQNLELQALVLLAQQDPFSLNVSAIADRLGVPRRKLYRLPLFMTKLSELREMKLVAKRPTKGFRLRGGGVEAVGARS